MQASENSQIAGKNFRADTKKPADSRAGTEGGEIFGLRVALGNFGFFREACARGYAAGWGLDCVLRGELVSQVFCGLQVVERVLPTRGRARGA